MKKIFTIFMILLLHSVIVFAAGPSIERIWTEEDPLNDNSYNFWIEVLNEDGETPGPDEVLVNYESKYDSNAMSWDEWKTGGRLASFYYYDESGTDYEKTYFKIQHGFLEEEIDGGLKVEYRITAKQGSNTVTKEESFTIGDYEPGKPDLVIEDIKAEPDLAEEMRGYHIPAIKFTLTIKNEGKKDAVLRDSQGTVGVFLKVNGNDFGWNTILEAGSAKSTTILEPDESMEFVLKYREQYHYSNMKIGTNIFSFFVDNTNGDYSSSYTGKIKESDETNNKYDYTYEAKACKDSEDGKSSNEAGTIELYGKKLTDECDGSKLIEYWCDRDFHIGYRTDTCKDKCVDGACGYGPKCLDSDSDDIHIKGSVSGYATEKQDSKYMYSDECISDSTLKEYICDGVYHSTMEKDCPYGCSNGACKHFYEEDEEIVVDEEETESTEGCPEKTCQVDSEECVDGNKIIIEKCTVYIEKENNCEQFSTTQNKIVKGACEEAEEEIICDTGCLIDKDSCIPISTRIEKNGEGYYCNYDNIVHKQKKDSSSCQNSYECESNNCKGSICVPICNGCFDEKFNCLPFGTRTDTQYCGLDKKMTNLKIEDTSCNNNFECTTNVCVNSKCISPNLIQKIILWFQNLFG